MSGSPRGRPELVRLGTAYSAQMVCSNAFLAGRDGQEVLSVDVQSPVIRCSATSASMSTRRRVPPRRTLLGLFAPGGSPAIAEGFGCSSMPRRAWEESGRNFCPAQACAAGSQLDGPQWPVGERLVRDENPEIAAILAN